ncbi:hypothetical protein ACTA71_008710 [Dictyostelium dimigraforme]
MKLLSILLSISFFVGFIQSQYILLETTYYGDDYCSKSPSSKSSLLSHSSLPSGFPQFQSNGGSLNSDVCYYSPLGGEIFKAGVCIPMGKSKVMFNISETYVITYSTYHGSSCEDDRQIAFIRSGSCINQCGNGFGVSNKFTIVDYPITPENILLTAMYPGECNDGYKDSFVYLHYQKLNYCELYSGIGMDSLQVNCNSTTKTTTVYTGDKNCKGRSQNFYSPIACSCGDYNIFQECQNY